MSNIIKKMCYQVPGRFLRFNILLAANMAKGSVQGSITIQTNFFRPFFKMTHVLQILLKIVQKNFNTKTGCISNCRPKPVAGEDTDHGRLAWLVSSPASDNLGCTLKTIHDAESIHNEQDL